MATYISIYRDNEGKVMQEEITPEENQLISNVSRRFNEMYFAFLRGEDPAVTAKDSFDSVKTAIEALPEKKRGHWHKALKGMGID